MNILRDEEKKPDKLHTQFESSGEKLFKYSVYFD